MATTSTHPRRARKPREKPTTPSIPVVDFRRVSKAYGPRRVGLERASMRIRRGEFVFLVGPRRSGKSTCVRLLLKEIEPSGGDVVVAGRTLSEIPRNRIPYLRRNIGTIFQDHKLLPDRTVYDNVAFALQVIGEDRQAIRHNVLDTLQLLGLSARFGYYPDELTAGERQRVALARAFVSRPPLLLADEPAGSLDPEAAIGILHLLYRINRIGTTVIVATRDKELVAKTRRRMIELDGGRVVRDERSPLYRRDESTTEFAMRLRGEMGIGPEGHPQ
jgi:cell division transport system ATP-binding protein